MALFWPSVFFLIYAFSTHANAAKTTLSPELTNFIPSCGRDCFATFLDSNYASTLCGTTPNLDCLCRTKSKSEYTVGEGAVQCILSALSIGSCSKGDAEDSVALKAYIMCNGKEGALPNTHGTLTATLVVETSSSTSVRPTSTSNFSASTAITASTTNPSSSLASTLITATESLPKAPTNTVAPTANATSAEEASESPTPSPTLSKQQVIGITVGSVAGGVIGIAGLIIFACWRKRKSRQARDSDMLPFQLDPSNGLNYGHGFRGPMEKRAKGPGGTVNGVAGRVPPRVPPRVHTYSPNMFSRRSIMPDTIGVAISPENKYSSQERQRRKSKLLPEKPALSLKVPFPPGKEGNGLSFSQPGPLTQSAISRQSIATQFEEDFDDSADTAVAADDSWGRGSSDQILHPSTGNWQSIRPVAPDPGPAAPAFFITGGDGDHWKPGQATTKSKAAATALEYYVKPLSLARGPVGSFSQPRRPDEYPARSQNYPQHLQYQQQQQSQPQRPQLQVTVPREAERPTTTASSIYDEHDSLPPSAIGRYSNPTPNSLSGTRARRSYKSAGPYDTHQSSGSLTSFETSGSTAVSPQDFSPVPKPILNVKTDVELRRRTLPLELSPVVESPPSGKSPVSYPKIPARGRLPENTIRMVPPPKQPDFTAAFTSGRAGGGPSPTTRSPIAASPIGVSPMGITPIEQSMKPWRAAEIQAQRERDHERAKIEVGMSQSPPEPRPQPAFPQRMQSLRVGTGQIWPEKGNMGPPPPRIRVPQQRRQEREYIAPSANFNLIPQRSNPQPRNFLQQQEQTQYQPYAPTQRQNTAPTPTPNPLTSHPSLTFTRSSSQASFHSQTSNSSSLLAKRRGEQKALALNLSNGDGGGVGGRGQSGKWRVLGQEEIKVAKSERWRPILGSNERERDGGGGYGGSGGMGGSDGELPRTPGWVPRLTPTRRGDELFLSVQ